MNISRIKETCIYVSDLQLTRDFYSGKLGLTVIGYAEDRHIFFKAGESVLLCFLAERTRKETELPPHGAFGSIHFAFEVPGDDYDANLVILKANGIGILHQQVWRNGFRSFYFHDPDNNLLEVIEEGLWDLSE